MKIINTGIPGLLVIEPQVFGDDRGFFMETYSQERYRGAGIGADFVQDNISFSQQGVLRGLHFQNPKPQGKLIYVLAGEVFDVAVDIRCGSPTFGEWHGEMISAANKRQVWVPPGFAHGFCVVSDAALFAYKCTELYAPQCEKAIRWDDPDIAINWPIDSPQLSAKDLIAPVLSEVSPEELFEWTEK